MLDCRVIRFSGLFLSRSLRPHWNLGLGLCSNRDENFFRFLGRLSRAISNTHPLWVWPFGASEGRLWPELIWSSVYQLRSTHLRYSFHSPVAPAPFAPPRHPVRSYAIPQTGISILRCTFLLLSKSDRCRQKSSSLLVSILLGTFVDHVRTHTHRQIYTQSERILAHECDFGIGQSHPLKYRSRG